MKSARPAAAIAPAKYGGIADTQGERERHRWLTHMRQLENLPESSPIEDRRNIEPHRRLLRRLLLIQQSIDCPPVRYPAFRPEASRLCPARS